MLELSLDRDKESWLDNNKRVLEVVYSRAGFGYPWVDATHKTRWKNIMKKRPNPQGNIISDYKTLHWI